MELSMQERLDKLLNAYSHHYDIERDVTVEGTFQYPVEVIEGKQFLNFVKVASQKLVMKLNAKQCDVKTIFKIKEEE